MIIGVPLETHRLEHRVGLTPFAVLRLTRLGHTVVIEHDAGAASHFPDEAYEQSGGQIVYGADEVYKRADVVCCVGLLSSQKLDLLKPESIILGFHHLAVIPKETVARLAGLETTLIGYEIIRGAYGDLPVLTPFSEMAGRLAVHIAAFYLQNENMGRGILLANVPGVPPPTILILGAGRAGRSAAVAAHGTGSHVIVLDDDPNKLRAVHHELGGQGVTALATKGRIERYTDFADVVIGAVLVPGARAPVVVTEEMVRSMRPGSVLIDLSIDQGGCVETSRPTSLDDPTFIQHGVVHYCVPNMTANIARTASRALAQSALPIVSRIAADGVENAVRQDAGLAEGVYMYKGAVVKRGVGETLGIETASLNALLQKDRAS
jgi:alanine dehydrogenase